MHTISMSLTAEGVWNATYSRLERGDLLVGQGIGLGNDRDQVDLGVQPLHDLDVQRLQGVARGLDEEDAGVDAVVHNVHAVHLVLGIKVGVETLLNVVNDWPPGLVIVDKVAKAGRVNHCQPQTNTRLLNIGADRLDSDGLRDDVEARALGLLGGVQRSVEESVDKCRLSEAGFTWKNVVSGKITQNPGLEKALTNNHDIEVETLPDALAVPLVGQVGKANVARQLPPDNVLVVAHSRGGCGQRVRWSLPRKIRSS